MPTEKPFQDGTKIINWLKRLSHTRKQRSGDFNIEHTQPTLANISRYFSDILSQKEGVIPPEPTLYHDLGEPAFMTSSEKALPGFFETIQSKGPDGYLVGIGAGTIFALLQCFPENVSPQGMIIVDYNPHVIAGAKHLVETLAASQTISSFRKAFFNLSERKYRKKMKQIAEKERNPLIRDRLIDVHRTFPSTHTPINIYTEAFSFSSEYSLNIAYVITEYFEMLHSLAKAGNIAVLYSNFINPELIDAVTDLPDFPRRINIIYSSNIFQFLDPLENIYRLRRYSNQIKSPIFIDASPATDFYLRVRHHLPIYSALEFEPRSFRDKTSAAKQLIFDESTNL